MSEDEHRIVDWAYLPDEVEKVSLWEVLHDGWIVNLRSERLTRTLTLELDVDHVRDFNHLPEGTLFKLVLSGVGFAAAVRWESWTGDSTLPDGMTTEENSAFYKDLGRKGRDVSISWSDLESSPESTFEVLQAEIAFGKLDAVALSLYLQNWDQDLVCIEVFVKAESIACSVGDQPATLEQFLALGEGFWRAFANQTLPGLQS